MFVPDHLHPKSWLQDLFAETIEAWDSLSILSEIFTLLYAYSRTSLCLFDQLAELPGLNHFPQFH